MDITRKQVIRYFMLPEFLPRIQELCNVSFVYIAFFLAQIYATTGLLPYTHPYLNPANRGRFGVRHVIAEAAANLTFKRENIDQIVVFCLLLVGMVILFLQFIMLFLALFVGFAHASGATMPTSFSGFFGTPNPTHDVAFVLMDRVLGIPDFFNSCVQQNIPCFDIPISGAAGASSMNNDAIADGTFPWPYHEALRQMFQFYSIGLLVVAALIVLYFVITVTVETAQSGTPFGRRFNHVWAPIRLVVALGLLMPVANGLNSAQYITLYAAKWGSGFATNGWNLFVGQAVTTTETLAGNTSNMVATPLLPDARDLLHFALLTLTCMEGVGQMQEDWVLRKMIGARTSTPPAPPAPPYPPASVSPALPPGVSIAGGFPSAGAGTTPYVVMPMLVGPVTSGFNAQLLDIPTTYQDAKQFYNGDDIRIRFGVTDNRLYPSEEGNTKMYCGELVIPTNDGDEPGAIEIKEQYFELIKRLFGVYGAGTCTWCGAYQPDAYAKMIVDNYRTDPPPLNPAGPMPTSSDFQNLHIALKAQLRTIATSAAATQAGTDWAYPLGQLGWGGAALWYNLIAQKNGALISSMNELPRASSYPAVWQEAIKKRVAGDEDAGGYDMSTLFSSDDIPIELEDPLDTSLHIVIRQAHNSWWDSLLGESRETNMFIAAINFFFGTEGLFNIVDNPDIHPLAQLVAIGRSLVESSIRNFAGSGVAMMAALPLPAKFSSVSMALSSWFFSIGMIGLAVGFVLFYVVPFLPFIYFFFAVGGWVKGIFEAMVGVPLWALAHIRIDGNGLPGDAAMGGYYLILEIFLRPILIVFGLVAGIQIFAAQVDILNNIWGLVTSSVAGFDPVSAAGVPAGQTGSMEFKRGPVDQFFFTVIYAIIVYMLAMASFKMINLVPNFVTRWLGASVQSFGDQAQDPAQNLVRNTYMGVGMLSGNVKQAQGGLGQAIQATKMRNTDEALPS